MATMNRIPGMMNIYRSSEPSPLQRSPAVSERYTERPSGKTAPTVRAPSAPDLPQMTAPTQPAAPAPAAPQMTAPTLPATRVAPPARMMEAPTVRARVQQQVAQARDRVAQGRERAQRAVEEAQERAATLRGSALTRPGEQVSGFLDRLRPGERPPERVQRPHFPREALTRLPGMPQPPSRPQGQDFTAPRQNPAGTPMRHRMAVGRPPKMG